MEKKYLLLLLFACFSLAQAPKKILFIGNSMTYFNDMPMLFESMANEKGKNVAVQMYAPGGTGFVNHVNDSNVYSLFQNNIWDTVVLQPGTGESAGASWPVNTTIQRGKQLQDSIKKYSPCAKIILYQIPYGVPSETTYGTYFQVQTQIRDSISKLADNMHVSFAPAGECARQHYTALQDLLLHNSYNDVHPNLNGSYLVACTMFCTLFQEPISGIAFNGGVSAANAAYFQGIADNVVLPHKSDWRINTFNLHAEFTFNTLGGLVNFGNASANYTSVLWDFGDGETSTDNSPSHQYTTTGDKLVTLTVTKDGCTDTFTKLISITSLGVNTFLNQDNVIFPTLATDKITFQGKDNYSFTVYSVQGQKLVSGEKTSYQYHLDVSQYSEGVYLIKLSDGKTVKFTKVYP